MAANGRVESPSTWNRSGCHYGLEARNVSKSDWLGIVLSLLSTGAGVVMTTIRRGTVRVAGLAVMVAGGLAAALLWSGYLPFSAALSRNRGIEAPENAGIVTQNQTGGLNAVNSPASPTPDAKR